MPSNKPRPDAEIPDKEILYGDYLRGERWRQNLAKKMTHKALDIPEDDVRIVQNQRGLTWRELLALGAILLGGGAAAWILVDHGNGEAPPGPRDTEYEVRFYDREGSPIDVPHITTRPESDVGPIPPGAPAP